LRDLPTAPDAVEPSEPGGWLTLGNASRILGVDESTLRRWADAGQIRAFRTPGGHRRFAEADVQAILSGRAYRPRVGPGDLGTLALSRIRRQLQRGPVHDAPWHIETSEEERERLRVLGRRLVTFVSDYLSGRSRRGARGEAREIGHEYGRELAQAGVSLRQTLEAFTFFRRSLDQATRQVAQKTGLSPEETLAHCEQIMSLADEVLLGIAESFEEPRKTAPSLGPNRPSSKKGPQPVTARRGGEGQ
jgi:excisionase family DNA binding protein